MMAELTIEQRAKRRAVRKNRKAERELPLFAGTPAIDPFLVTWESQVPIVERNIATGQAMLDRLRRLDEDFTRLAKARRAEIIELTDDLATVELLDRKLADLAARWPAMATPSNQADWWWQQLINVLNR